MKRKKKIPIALKREVWIKAYGEVFKGKCSVKWCNTLLNPFIFEAGHNLPESKGGLTTIDNLLPICSSCNKSMGNRYTIDDFSDKFKDKAPPVPDLKQHSNWLLSCFCSGDKIVPKNI
jgi:5-methylcytosine-specific restriction endonuclease McrA